MATYTSNYSLEKPLVTERYDVGVFNGNADIIDGVMHDNAVHVQNTQDMIAPPFDTNTAYAIGDRVTYNNNLYQFTSAHAVGAWDSSEVTIVNISDAIGTGGGGSTVVPNPTGASSGQLNSIGIDGVKYTIAGGGGGVDRTTLSNTVMNAATSYTLSDDYTNYDFIEFWTANSDYVNSECLCSVVDAGVFEDMMDESRIYTITGYGSRFINLSISGTTLTIQNLDGMNIIKIVGVSLGGGGGTSDYPQLTNKPQINSVTLVGNKTSSDLGVVDVSDNLTQAQITALKALL